jgi:hypothetical protein
VATLKDETLGGLAPPLNFVRGKPSCLSPAVTAAILKGGS